jgi:hypothetical protein
MGERSMSILALGGDGQGAVLIIIFALVAGIVVFTANRVGLLSKPQRRRFRNPYQLSRFDQYQSPDLADVGQQLNAVMAGSFERKRVLNSSEYRVFAIVEDEIAAQRAGYRVFAQTSLGEILRSSEQDAFRSINSKRVDILVVDRGGWPILAIEYQGNGHYQGTAAARDAVKKEALRKAGVRYMECCEADTNDQIKCRLREHLVGTVAALSTTGGTRARRPVSSPSR